MNNATQIIETRLYLSPGSPRAEAIAAEWADHEATQALMDTEAERAEYRASLDGELQALPAHNLNQWITRKFMPALDAGETIPPRPTN